VKPKSGMGGAIALSLIGFGLLLIVTAVRGSYKNTWKALTSNGATQTTQQGK
jgi:hypothetical protein